MKNDDEPRWVATKIEQRAGIPIEVRGFVWSDGNMTWLPWQDASPWDTPAEASE